MFRDTQPAPATLSHYSAHQLEDTDEHAYTLATADDEAPYESALKPDTVRNAASARNHFAHLTVQAASPSSSRKKVTFQSNQVRPGSGKTVLHVASPRTRPPAQRVVVPIPADFASIVYPGSDVTAAPYTSRDWGMPDLGYAPSHYEAPELARRPAWADPPQDRYTQCEHLLTRRHVW